jgi:pyruvate/2-oxoglutarate dehydrogenase complex dihydrolipoamide acyltransferase (E2) component
MNVLMPQLGETVAEGKISKWFVSAGDAVKPGDNLFEIETDKVSMEVPAISAGVLSTINVAAGETAPVGAVVAIILGAGERPSAPLTPAPGSDLRPARGQALAGVQKSQALGPRLRGDERETSLEVAASAPRPAFQMEPFREVRSPERNYGPARLAGGTVVTPLARRLAGEAGIDLSAIKGSGPRGRIVAADVDNARDTKAPAIAQARAVASIVVTADVGIAHALALCADVPAIELTDIIIKAWAAALAGVVPTEQSEIALMFGKSRPVIRHAASLSLTAIATARRNFGAGEATHVASTAISMPGVRGITAIAEVLRPPHTTMLGIGAPRRAPVEAADGSVKFVDMMTATLTCDHRVIDSALGAELLSAFKGFVEQPVMMIV